MEPHRIAETSAVKSGRAAPINRTVNLAGKMLGKALLALTLGAPASFARADVELYEPEHRSAHELALLLDPALGTGGRAVADPGTGALLLTGTATELGNALELLSRLDVPLSRYIVESRLESREALRLQGYLLETGLQLGTLRFARLREPPARDGPGRLLFHESGTARERRLEQSLLVAEGQSAELWTGALMPIRVRNFELRDRGERVVETEPLLALRTGFQLRPRDLPDGQVELELVAVETRSQAGSAIARTSITAHLRLPLGEWTVVSELQTSKSLSGTMTLDLHPQIDPNPDDLLLFRVLRAPDN